MKDNFKFDLLTNQDFQISEIGTRNLYNTDIVKPASEWVREKIKGKKTFDMPQMSSALNVKQKGYGMNTIDSLGYLYNDSNNVYKNSQGVCIVSSVFSHGHGVPICRENFLETVALFTARKVIKMDWTNEYDEYLKPIESDSLNQFMADSIVYSLFSTHSQQSSLRNVLYKNSYHDIYNNFFWISCDHVKNLSDRLGLDGIYNDVRVSDDRFIYEILFGQQNLYSKLSEESKNILEISTNLFDASLELRSLIADEHNGLHNWDAGYAQLKNLWKDSFPNLFENLRNEFNRLQITMKPLVYETGFLRS